MSAIMAILVTGLGTYLSRAIFIVALAQRRFPPLALRALEYVAPAVMGALIITMLTSPRGEVLIGAPELFGLVVAAVVARTTRNHVLTLFAAMGAFWLLAYVM
ncbi:MAG: AzlD domain-containing protein [Pseudomonadota bacterium]